MAQVYLVPGFFGFNEIGSFNYFNRVAEVLAEALAERGLEADIIESETLPAGSIRRRALRLLEVVCDHGGLEQDHIHFVGHSTGGLDVRLLLSPGVRLQSTREELKIAARTRTAITLSTPHYGSPLASFFTSMNGRNLLYVMTVLATSLPGRYSLYLSSRLIYAGARLARVIGEQESRIDAFAEKVLKRLKPERGDDLWNFVGEISRDQGAMVQLTPEAMDLFNSAVSNRRHVDYVSFVSASPPPDLRSFLLRRRNLYEPFTHAVYALGYAMASREHPQYPCPEPDPGVMARIRDALPFELTPGTNDGVVPTLSQIWGRLGGMAVGDHLDVVGQFEHTSGDRKYGFWVKSGSSFSEESFRQLWAEIASVICGVRKPGDLTG